LQGLQAVVDAVEFGARLLVHTATLRSTTGALIPRSRFHHHVSPQAGSAIVLEECFVASWRDVSTAALSLPGTAVETSHGQRAWSVGDKGFVWERPLRRGDLEALGADAPKGPILGVRTDGLEMKEALLAGNPRVYFTTPHFDGFPAVLVQLDKIALKELRAIIREAWLARAPKRLVDVYLLEGPPKKPRQRRAKK
jgi:hypothetical protein